MQAIKKEKIGASQCSSRISTFKTERPPPSDQIWPKTRGGGRSDRGGAHFGSCVRKSNPELIITSYAVLPTPRQLSDAIWGRSQISQNSGSRKQGGGRSVRGGSFSFKCTDPCTIFVNLHETFNEILDFTFCHQNKFGRRQRKREELADF